MLESKNNSLIVSCIVLFKTTITHVIFFTDLAHNRYKNTCYRITMECLIIPTYYDTKLDSRNERQ